MPVHSATVALCLLRPPPSDSGSVPARYEGGAWTMQPKEDKAKELSWARAAGRKSGPEGYRFGDGTRALLGALRGKKDRGWKEAAGRAGGKDSYKFGDMTRLAVSNLFGDKHKRKGADADMGVMPTPTRLFQSTADLELTASGAPASVLDGVWLGFFNSTYAVGRLALLAGELSVDAIEDADPSVLIGLPALAALECAIRSATAASDGKLVAFDGTRVGRNALVAGATVDRVRGVGRASDTLALFDTMVELAQRVGVCRLSAAGLASLRARTLAVSGTDTRVALEPTEDAEVNGLVALSQSVATRLSQTLLYKRAFEKVLRALSDEQRHERDMMDMMAAV